MILEFCYSSLAGLITKPNGMHIAVACPFLLYIIFIYESILTLPKLYATIANALATNCDRGLEPIVRRVGPVGLK